MYLPSEATPLWLAAAADGREASSFQVRLAMSYTCTRRVSGKNVAVPPSPVNPPIAYTLLPTCTTPASVRGTGERGAFFDQVMSLIAPLGVGVEAESLSKIGAVALAGEPRL